MDSKGIAGAILKKGAPADEDSGSQYDVVAGNILDAIKNDDAAGLAAELKSFHEMCTASSDEGEGESY